MALPYVNRLNRNTPVDGTTVATKMAAAPRHLKLGLQLLQAGAHSHRKVGAANSPGAVKVVCRIAQPACEQTHKHIKRVYAPQTNTG